ncbi:SDR family oxidoreductase [Hanamia caeni]|uniref:SDR family oxidoreductase n=1 Tax=Hanamia caeni TaxID=2294116 RepID=UPI0018F644C1|nr:SDR family oxidoreductase [Hanamia caeni]
MKSNSGMFSVTSISGNKYLLDYSTTKGGIHAFTHSLSANLISKGIRVNAVAPGPVWTLLNPSDKEEKQIAKSGSTTPMKGRLNRKKLHRPMYFLRRHNVQAISRVKYCLS